LKNGAARSLRKEERVAAKRLAIIVSRPMLKLREHAKRRISIQVRKGVGVNP